MNTIAKNIQINLVCELESYKSGASLDYTVGIDLDGTGEIKITPISPDASFIDAYLTSELADIDSATEFSRIFAIQLSANLELTDTEDDDFKVDINDIGEVVITPYAALDGTSGNGKFVAVTEVGTSVASIEEEVEDIAATDPEVLQDSDEITSDNISAEVIEEAATPYTEEELTALLIDITNNWMLESGELNSEFEAEHQKALNILDQHYEYVEDCGENNGTFSIKFNSPIAAESLQEDAQILPFDRKAAQELSRLMSVPQDRKHAENRLKVLFNTDELEAALAEADDLADIRHIIQQQLAAALAAYDKDSSEFKIELDSDTRRILDGILNTDYNTSITEDVESDDGPEWIITYELAENLAMLTEDQDAITKQIINAPDASTVAKYAEQFARMQARENSNWKDAQIIGIQRRSDATSSSSAE